MNDNRVTVIPNNNDSHANTLKKLADNYELSLELLAKIINSDIQTLNNVIDNGDDLDISQANELEEVDIIFTHVFGDDNMDTLLIALIDRIAIEYGISYNTIAKLSNTELNAVVKLIDDSSSVSLDSKYKIAVTTLRLYILLKDKIKQ